MSVAATLAVSGIGAVLAVGLTAAYRRYPKTKYWYVLVIAVVFLCLGLSLGRDRFRHNDPIIWLLALMTVGFGVGVAGVGLRGLYRPAPCPTIARTPREVDRLLALVGIGVGAGIPWAIWVGDTYVVGLLN